MKIELLIERFIDMYNSLGILQCEPVSYLRSFYLIITEKCFLPSI